MTLEIGLTGIEIIFIIAFWEVTKWAWFNSTPYKTWFQRNKRGK